MHERHYTGSGGDGHALRRRWRRQSHRILVVACCAALAIATGPGRAPTVASAAYAHNMSQSGTPVACVVEGYGAPAAFVLSGGHRGADERGRSRREVSVARTPVSVAAQRSNRVR